MGLLFLALFSLLIILITNISKMVFRHNFLSYIFTVAFLFIISGLATYTPDWWGYEFWITEGKGRDLFFNFFITHLLPPGQGYQFVHITFNIVYAIMLVYFVSRFTDHVFLVCLLYMFAIYLFYTAQIRYSMGYFSIFIGFYFWQVRDQKIPAILFILFALANHASLFTLLPLLFLFKLDFYKLMPRVIQILIISTAIFLVFKAMVLLIPEEYYLFLYFVEVEHKSSFLGGLFTFLPTVFSMFALHFYAMNKTVEYPELLDDKNFIFLYKFMVVPLLFFGIATERQVLGHRFILPSILFQLLLIMYLGYYNTARQNAVLRWTVVFIVPFFFFHNYVLSKILVDSELSDMVMKILDSNPIVSYFY